MEPTAQLTAHMGSHQGIELLAHGVLLVPVNIAASAHVEPYRHAAPEATVQGLRKVGRRSQRMGRCKRHTVAGIVYMNALRLSVFVSHHLLAGIIGGKGGVRKTVVGHHHQAVVESRPGQSQLGSTAA